MWKDLEGQGGSHGPRPPQVVSPGILNLSLSYLEDDSSSVSPAQTPQPDSRSPSAGSRGAGSTLPHVRSGAPLSRAAPGLSRLGFSCRVYILTPSAEIVNM